MYRRTLMAAAAAAPFAAQAQAEWPSQPVRMVVPLPPAAPPMSPPAC